MNFFRSLLIAALILAPVAAHAANPLEAGLVFQPMIIPVGGTSVMSIEISNPNDVAAAGLAASDFYPSSIFNAGSASTTCGGTVSAVPGSSSFSFSGGSLAAHATCVITIDVSAPAGFWVNALDPGSVTSTTVPANASFSSALLIVNGGPPPASGPGVSMSFSPASIHSGKTTTLSIALKNSNTAALTGVAFALEYPAALINTPDGASSSCGGTASTKSGSRSLTFSGGSIPAGGTCRVDVVVRGSSPGTYTVALPAGSVTSSSHPASTSGASAAVTVASSK